MKNGGQEAIHVVDLRVSKADASNTLVELLSHALVLGAVDITDGFWVAANEAVASGIPNLVLGLLLGSFTGEKQVKDVEVALTGGLADDTGLLKQVLVHEGTLDGVLLVEAELDELSEARGVVVTESLGVSVRFQQGVELDDLIFEAHLSHGLAGVAGSANIATGVAGAQTNDLLDEELG